MKLVKSICVAMLLGTIAIQAVWADADADAELLKAVSNEDLLGVKYQIVKNGADVNAKQNEFYGAKTVLMLAVRYGYSEIAKYLISKGADVNAKDNYGETALHYAAEDEKRYEIAKYLISKGADVNAKDNYGETALHYAAKDEKRYEIVKYLISNGADVNAKDNRGDTALYEAVSHKKYEIAKYLIYKGADINAKTNGGGTILMKVAETEDYKQVTTVERQKNNKLSHNVGIDAVKTTTVAGGEVLEMVKYLVEKGADVNAKSEYSTPLGNATYKNNIEIVKYLVSKGADVNLASGDGKTPLMRASEHGNLALVKYFISKGANADVKDNKGKTTIEYAYTDEIRKILQEQILKELE